jgi:hypothetical protein
MVRNLAEPLAITDACDHGACLVWCDLSPDRLLLAYTCRNTQLAVADHPDIQYVRITPNLVERHVAFLSKQGMRQI